MCGRNDCQEGAYILTELRRARKKLPGASHISTGDHANPRTLRQMAATFLDQNLQAQPRAHTDGKRKERRMFVRACACAMPSTCDACDDGSGCTNLCHNGCCAHDCCRLTHQMRGDPTFDGKGVFITTSCTVDAVSFDIREILRTCIIHTH